MCDGTQDVTVDFGVIRSHPSYPWDVTRSSSTIICRKILYPKPGHTLTLHMEDFHILPWDSVSIFHVNSSGPRLLRGNWNHDEDFFSVTSGRVILDYVIGERRGTEEESGFVLRFERKLPLCFVLRFERKLPLCFVLRFERKLPL